MKLGQTESFTFGDVYGCVDIDQVGRRSVCLITGDAAILMCPVRPLAGEVLQQ